MATLSPSKKILFTKSFWDYYKTHYPESLSYLMEQYDYQFIEYTGVEFCNVSLDDESFINDVQKEFLKEGYHD